MSYVPSYTSRINWENEPSTTSPINETNLNKMDYALYQHDQALQGQDSRISTLEDADKVTSFKGRTGAVVPVNDDYTIAQIKATGTAGQVPTLNSQGKLEMQTPDAGGHVIEDNSGNVMPQQGTMQFNGSGVSVTNDVTNGKTVVTINGGGGGGSGHTIQNPSGSSMTQRTNLQFTGTGVTVTDNSAGDKTVVEITDKGHTIKDGDGTAMPTQPNLQFADANVSNDGTNNATVIQNFVDIDWDDWQEVDDNDDTYYRVTDAPLVDGNVEVDLMKKLWENPAPTASFVAQTITLNSADYDFIRVYFNYDTSFTLVDIAEAPKGKRVWLNAVDNATAKHTYMRTLEFSSDTVATFSGAYLDGTTNNSVCIPIAIYGIKQKVSISLSAIISNVSTSASKCMLSDGETSVEDTLNYSTDEHVVGKWIDGSILYEKTLQINSTNDGVYHNLSFSSLGINPNVIFVKEHFLQGSNFAIYGNTWNASNYFYEVSRDGDNIRYTNHWGSDSTHSDKIIITIRYTKTS